MGPLVGLSMGPLMGLSMGPSTGLVLQQQSCHVCVPTRTRDRQRRPTLHNNTQRQLVVSYQGTHVVTQVVCGLRGI